MIIPVKKLSIKYNTTIIIMGEISIPPSMEKGR
jgi:hypothetical protein